MNQIAPDLEQQEVIGAEPAARILVHAGPGSGKTQVAALRLAHLLGAGVRPRQILVLSFSNNAVRTLMRRLERTSNASAAVTEDLRHLSVRTFDSWTFRVLRQLGESAHDLIGSYDKNVQALTGRIEGEDDDLVMDLLGGIRHVIIDEFQDLTGLRARLVLALLRLLSPPEGGGAGFTVLGDPAQAIYGFTAAAGNFNESEQDADHWDGLRACYGRSLREIELSHNHRAVKSLSEVTLRLRDILRQKTSGAKKLALIDHFLDQFPPSTTHVSADWLTCLPKGSVAILTRTNGEALRVAKQLLGNEVDGPAVPFVLQLAQYRHPVPAWIAALLSPFPGGHLVKSKFDQIHAHVREKYKPVQTDALGLPPVDVAWARLLHASGAADVESSLDMASLRKRIEWPDAFPDDHAVSDVGLYITTIHQSKGMEFDSVALLRHVRGEQETGEREVAEEARVAFVAITRASKQFGVIASDCIYQPFTKRDFHKGMRSRLYRWWSGWANIEIGISGDIDPSGFVDTRVHGSTERVAEVQQLLLKCAADIRGHKVLLCKRASAENPGHVLYGIHLQEPDDGLGVLIGITTPQTTWDLLSLLGKDYSLPRKIMNLRIAEVMTVRGSEEMPEHVPAPYRLSRLWLGVTLIGTGDFKPFKKYAKG